MSNAIHFCPEYGPDGLVARLHWSPEYQAAAEQARVDRRAKSEEEKRRAKQPMAAMREWAERHGLT